MVSKSKTKLNSFAFYKSIFRIVPLKVVTNEKGEAVGEVVTIIC